MGKQTQQKSENSWDCSEETRRVGYGLRNCNIYTIISRNSELINSTGEGKKEKRKNILNFLTCENKSG